MFFTHKILNHDDAKIILVMLKEAIALCDRVVNLLLHAVVFWDRKCLDMVHLTSSRRF